MREFCFALKQTVPILFTYIFIGIAYGVMMEKAGYGPIWSFLSALFIFAGSMQIVMVPLLQAGVPLWNLALMTLLINARHLFYGIAFIDPFAKMGWRYPYMVFSLTDETYSILCFADCQNQADPQKATFYIALLNHSYWVVGCTLGALAGQLLDWDLRGIDFSATALFTVVVVNHWQEYPSKIPIFVGLGSSIFFYLLMGPGNFILPALATSMVGLVLLKDRVLFQSGGVGDVG